MAERGGDAPPSTTPGRGGVAFRFGDPRSTLQIKAAARRSASARQGAATRAFNRTDRANVAAAAAARRSASARRGAATRAAARGTRGR